MDVAVIQLLTILVQLALQVAPEVEQEAKIVIDAINGKAPTATDIAALQASVLALQAKADADADVGMPPDQA